MEQAQKYYAKLDKFKKGVTGFKRSLELDISGLNEDYKDTLKNGNIQKFEICVELLWKTVKVYLETFYDSSILSPQQCIKEFYNIVGIDEELYEELSNMIKDRNLLSHDYNENDFDNIFKKLPGYLTKMIDVIEILETKKQSN